MKFKLGLTGSKCNEYPRLTILHNQQIVYSELIEESTEVELDIELQKDNLITLHGIEKSQGQDNKWDTQLDNDGQIIADKWLSINNIWIDDISMGQEWMQSLTLVDDNNNKERFLSKTFWNNGSINFSIQPPVLDWIIQEKFINSEENIITPHHAKSGERRFDYMYIQEKIKAIRKIIND
jgi:hypothetical protein